MKVVKSIALWFLTSFFALWAFAFCPSFSSLFALLFASLVAPISKWQEIIAKYIKGKLKIIIAIILVVLAFFTATRADIESAPATPPATATEQSASSADVPTAEPATEDTVVADDVVVETTVVEEPSVAEPAESASATPEPATDVAPEVKPEPVHTHSFNVATCTAPKTCSCGATEGTANGHSWKNATCVSPKKCTICGATTGSTIGHSFSGGNCSVCGANDPNYVRETMVWIPTNGGTKYHSHSSCSNMVNPQQITQSSAEARGFTACKRCH